MPNTLLPGASLLPQPGLDSLDSSSLPGFAPHYRLQYGTNGNLVLYDLTQNPPAVLWQAGTPQHAAGKVTLENNGTLVIYDSAGRSVWTSSYSGVAIPGGSVSLVLQDDGNLVLWGVTALFTTFKDVANQHAAHPPPGSGINFRSIVQLGNDITTVFEIASALPALFP